MITIKEVASKSDMRKFCNFPLKLYKGNKYYCPPLYGDELALYDPEKKGIYGDYTDTKFFLAYRDGELVGRIAALINHAYIEKWGDKCGRFTRFDVIDDYEVSKALLDAACAYFRENGLTKINGPMGYNDLDREGLLVEGFDYHACYGSSYNFPYYLDHLERYGFTKQVDWLEWRLDRPTEPNEKLNKVAELVQKKYNFHDLVDNKAKVGVLLKKYGKKIFELLDITYGKLHGTVPLTEKFVDNILGFVGLLLDPKYLSVIADENDNIVAVGVCLKGIWKALNKAKGKLFPFGIFHLLKAVLFTKEIEFALIGVLPEYQKTGVHAMVMARITENIRTSNLGALETNAVLEENLMMKNQWMGYPGIQHKRKRCLVMDL